MRAQYTKAKGFAVLVTFITLTTSIVNSAHAQTLEKPAARQGYYFGLGLSGILNANFEDDDGWFGPWPGGGLELRTGQSINSWLDLGIGFGSSVAAGKDYINITGHFSLEATIRVFDPVFIRGRAGFGFDDISRRRSDIVEPSGRVGGSYAVSAGYDFFPFYDGGSGGLGISPVVIFEIGPDDNFATGFMGVGIEINWWTGLDKDKLDLPIEEAY